MRILLALVTLNLFTISGLYAETKTAAADGNWSTAGTWSPSGVPSSTDDVIIGTGYTVTLDADYTCASLTLNNTAGALGATDSELIISDGFTLTVTGNAAVNSTVLNVFTGSCYVQVLGTLSVGGNLTMTNSLVALGGSNVIEVGSSSTAGTFNLTGNLTQDNALISALGAANQITMIQGVLDIDGSITMNAGALSLLAGNLIVSNDDGSGNGKSKIFKYGGNSISTNDEGSITIEDANGNTDYQFWYDGTASQTIEVDNITYNDLYVKNTSADVDLEASLTNTLVEGKLYIDTGAVLHIDVASKNLDALSGATDKINILAYGTLKLSPNAYPDGLPPNTVITSNVNGYVEFHHPTEGVANDILQEPLDFPIIRLTGPGTKQMGSSSNDIDDAAPRASKIWLEEGIFVVDAGKEITLNSSYGVKTIQLDSNTTMRIDGDFSALDTYWDVHRDNTINYYGNSTQTLYELTRDGTAYESYGILRLERTSGSAVSRYLPASDTIQIANRLEIQDEIALTLNGSSYVQLLSDIQYTAYITEISSSASITYSGSPAGEFGIQKYLPLPYRAFRDLCSPIQGTTLASWKDAGVNMRGFTGSNSPSAGRTTVTYYDETVLDELNIGFQDASNTTNSVHTFDGSEFEISAWRILDGNNADSTYAVTLEDKGEIFSGDLTYKLKFTFSDTGSDSRNDHDGWNHVGNPYASPLNWNAIYNDPANATLKSNGYITSSMYILGQIDRFWLDSENPGYYGFYNAATETTFIHDSIIPAYQGFWVKAHHASSASEAYTLTIKESHKINHESSVYYKNKSGKGKNIQDVATQLTLVQGNKKESVWIQPFPKATKGKDQNFDVAQFGSWDNKSFGLDLYEEETSLNLWVNALDFATSDRIEIPIKLKSNRTGLHELVFSNLDATLGAHCLVLENPITQETWFPKDGVPIEITFNDTGWAAFTLVYSNAFETQVQINQPACAEENGRMLVTTDPMFYSENWSLHSDGVLVQTKNLDESGWILNLVPGNYRLSNPGGYVQCGANEISFEVLPGAQVNANFSISKDTLDVGETVSLTAAESDAGYYEWVIDEMFYSTPEVNLNFESAGLKTVKLHVGKGGCEKQSMDSIWVQTPTGLSELELKKNELWIENTRLYSKANAQTIRIFTTDGKLIKTQHHQNQTPLLHGTYLYCFDEKCIKISSSLP